jgi:hypothetical protein
MQQEIYSVCDTTHFINIINDGTFFDFFRQHKAEYA